jgi:hypothetical protein
LQLLHAEQNPHDELFNATLQLLRQQLNIIVVVIMISLRVSVFQFELTLLLIRPVVE